MNDFCLVWYFVAKTGNFPLKDVPFLDLTKMSMSTVSFLALLDSELSAYRMLSFYLWSYLSGFKSRINKHLLIVCSFDIAPFPWVKFVIFGQFFPGISTFFFRYFLSISSNISQMSLSLKEGGNWCSWFGVVF